MSAETALFAALANDAVVGSIIGGGTAARVYPDVVPQDKPLPSIAYQRQETSYPSTIHQLAPTAEDVTLEISCMSPDRVAADALAAACIPALGAAGFRIVDRRADFDPDNEFRGTVLVVQHFAPL